MHPTILIGRESLILVAPAFLGMRPMKVELRLATNFPKEKKSVNIPIISPLRVAQLLSGKPSSFHLDREIYPRSNQRGL